MWGFLLLAPPFDGCKCLARRLSYSMILALLAVAVIATDPALPVTKVNFNGKVVKVTAPPPMADFASEPQETLFSPRGDAVAVRFCWDAIKYWFCQVKLARASGKITVLNNSSVNQLLWTADGRYLIGAGNNTLRLWNLSGGLITATPIFTDDPQASTHIEYVQLKNRSLCLTLSSQPNLSSIKPRVAYLGYSLPQLKQISASAAQLNCQP